MNWLSVLTIHLNEISFSIFLLSSTVRLVIFPIGHFWDIKKKTFSKMVRSAWCIVSLTYRDVSLVQLAWIFFLTKMIKMLFWWRYVSDTVRCLMLVFACCWQAVLNFEWDWKRVRCFRYFHQYAGLINAVLNGSEMLRVLKEQNYLWLEAWAAERGLNWSDHWARDWLPCQIKIRLSFLHLIPVNLSRKSLGNMEL